MADEGARAGRGSSVGTAVLSNCVVAWNSAGGVGGGADLSILYGCRVFSNFSGNAGGTARSYLTNCVVAFNNYGGARFNVFVANTLFYGNRGWAAYVRTGDRVENCTFAGNDTGLQTDNNSTVAVVNVISYSNANNWVQNDTSVFRFTNSCTTPATLVWDASNTTNPPRFVAYGTGLNTNHIPGNYRLAPDSPCINAGLILPGMAAATDLDDRPRIDRLFQRVDMGAYEFMGVGALLRVK